MASCLSRVVHLVWKEIIQIGRDRQMLSLLLIMPLLEMTIFGYVVAIDVENIGLAVCDFSRSAESRAYVAQLLSGRYFRREAECNAVGDVDRLLDEGAVRVALVIPPDFAVRIKRGEAPEVMAAVDGSDSNTATISATYLEQITQSEAVDVLFVDRSAPPGALPVVRAAVEPRVWFNPELRNVKFMVPGIIAVLLMESLVVMTALAIVREKEQGTLEQLIVTPIRSFELIIGKAVPFVGIGYINMAIVSLAGTYWFSVPMRGDIALLFALSGVFILTCLGLGLLVSTISHTQQQAMLAGQFVLLPNLFFSSFMFPISSMPEAIQYLTYIMPLRYYITIVRGIFLKGVGWAELRDEVGILVVFSAVILTAASLAFRKRVA